MTELNKIHFSISIVLQCETAGPYTGYLKGGANLKGQDLGAKYPLNS